MENVSEDVNISGLVDELHHKSSQVVSFKSKR